MERGVHKYKLRNIDYLLGNLKWDEGNKASTKIYPEDKEYSKMNTYIETRLPITHEMDMVATFAESIKEIYFHNKKEHLSHYFHQK